MVVLLQVLKLQYDIAFLRTEIAVWRYQVSCFGHLSCYKTECALTLLGTAGTNSPYCPTQSPLRLNLLPYEFSTTRPTVLRIQNYETGCPTAQSVRDILY